MTEEEFPFKVGDVVWYVSGSERCFEATRCTVTRFNKWKFEPYEVATISVDMAGHGPIACLPGRLHLKPPPPPKPRRSTEEVIASFRFKPGDRVMQSNYGYGVVIGFASTQNMRVDFKYFGERHVDPEDLTMRPAQAGDEDWDPRQPPEPVAEPCYPPAEATLECLAEAIHAWAEILRGFAHGFDCIEEYQHDLMAREEVHGIVNGLHQAGIPIPADLQERLAAADQEFIRLTDEEANCVWSRPDIFDRQRFWYYFRWLRS